MVCMAALAWLPTGAIAAVGIALIVLHNMTDAIAPAAFGESGGCGGFSISQTRTQAA
jgi:hypothetical protein